MQAGFRPCRGHGGLRVAVNSAANPSPYSTTWAALLRNTMSIRPVRVMLMLVRHRVWQAYRTSGIPHLTCFAALRRENMVGRIPRRRHAFQPDTFASDSSEQARQMEPESCATPLSVCSTIIDEERNVSCAAALKFDRVFGDRRASAGSILFAFSQCHDGAKTTMCD